MKKLIGMVLMVLTAVVFNCNAAFAADASVMAIPGSIGVVGGLYDYYVTTVEMAGRSGLTQTGAKGIAFEAEAMNKINFQNMFNSVSTQMSESAIDPAYDLVMTAKDGSMIKGIQCKAGISNANVNDTVKRIVDGYYPEGTEFLGTTESSQAVNTALEKAGSDVRMKDSGISDKRINELAGKALGNQIEVADMLKHMGKSAALFAVFDMGIAGVESCLNGYDAAHTVSNMSISGVEGLAAGALTSLAADGMTNALILVGAGTTATHIVPIVVAFGTTMVVMYVLDDVVEDTNLEEIVANALTKAGTEIKYAAVEIKEKAVEFASEAGNVIEAKALAAKASIAKTGEVIGKSAEKAGNAIKAKYSETFGTKAVASN